MPTLLLRLAAIVHIAVLTALLPAGCAPLPPSAADTAAKRFESVPGKAVIYIVRAGMDSQEASGLWLDDAGPITTYPATYYRWVADPGMHRIAGFGRASESLSLTTAPGQTYFVEHTVYGRPRTGPTFTGLRQIAEADGRALVMRSSLIE